MKKFRIHNSICTLLTNLYNHKNNYYGDRFSKARKEIPNYTAGKLYDKVMRYIIITSKGESNFESVEDTLMDLANYAIMELVERQLDSEVEDGKEETSN